MPPRRRPANEGLGKEVYNCGHMMRLKQQVEALTQQFQAFLATQNQQNQNHNPYDSDEDALGGDDFRELPRLRRRPPIHYEDERRQDDKRLWDLGMHTKVPEFHGSLPP